jgi:hypothetical protein
MVRGINRYAIFEDDQDRQEFIERIGENIIKPRCPIANPGPRKI